MARPKKTADQSKKAARTCLLVVGMHRSGTSAIARLVSMLGASLPRRMLGAGTGNEAGHWEPERLITYHEQMLSGLGSAWHDWKALDLKAMPYAQREQVAADIADIVAEDYGDSPLFVIKEPRISRFAGFFCQALARRDINVNAIVAFRNPLDVIDSLIARQSAWPADHDRSDAALLWLSHMLDAEKAARGLKHTFVSYDAIIADPAAVMESVVETLGINTPISVAEAAPDMKAFISKSHRHHAHYPDEVLLDPQLSGWVADSYSALRDLEADRNLSGARETLDRIRHEFNSAMPLLSATTAARRKAFANTQEAMQKAAQSEAECQQLMNEHSALTAELESVKSEYEAQLAAKEDKLQATIASEQELRQSHSASQAALSEAQDAAQDALARAEAIEARFVQGQAEMEDLRREIAQAQHQLSAQSHDADQARQALAEAQAHKADLAALLDQLRADHAAELETVRDAWKVRLTAKNAEIASSLEQAEQARQALAKAEAHKAELTASLNQLRADHAAALAASRNAMDESLSQKDTEIARATEEARQSTNRVAELNQALNNARVLAAKLEGRMSQLKAKHDSVETKLALKTRAHNQAVARIAEVHATYRSATSWRITAPLRAIRAIPRKARSATRSFLNMITFGEGLAGTIRHPIRYLRRGFHGFSKRD